MSRYRIFLLFFFIHQFAYAQAPVIPSGDDEFIDFIAAAGNAAEYPGSEALIVLDQTFIKVEDSGLGHTSIRHVDKVLTDKGALKYSRLRFDYDPMSNMVDIKKVRIFRKNGMIENVDLMNVRDLPQPQDWIIWGPRMKIVPLSRLYPGDAVEYEIYKKGFMIAYLKAADEDSRYIPPMRGHYYDVVYFDDALPINLKQYTVVTSKNKPLQYEVYNGTIGAHVSFTESENTYQFWKTDVPSLQLEPRSADTPDIATKVVMATVSDWPAKSRWFYRANDFPWEINPTITESVFTYDDEIKQTVDEISKDAQTDEEKIAAIVHWAAQEIRYSGISMGPGEGYTIQPGKMIFHNRCGVCKDKAGMAITMLRAAGFEAYPAMTMAGSRVERIPADQFNHCVVALKNDDQSFTMLDPTWVVFSPELWSSAESEQHYVIGSSKGEELMITPLSAAENHTVEMTSEASIDANGNLDGKLLITGKGYQDQRLRRLMVHAVTAANRRSIIENWVNSIAPQAELLSFTMDYHQILDLSRPIQFEISYRIPGYALVYEDHFQFVPPALAHLPQQSTFVPYLSAANQEKRTQSLSLRCTGEWKISEKITLPDRAVSYTIPDDVNIDRSAASARIDYQVTDNVVQIDHDITVKLRTVQPEQYAGFKEVMKKAKQSSDEPIIIRFPHERK